MPRDGASKKGKFKRNSYLLETNIYVTQGKSGKGKKKSKRVSHTLTQDDIDFLKKNTRYDEQEIKEWYR